MKPTSVIVFPSQLGWMGVAMANEALCALSFGHPSASAAEAAIAKLCGGCCPKVQTIRSNPARGRGVAIVARLQAYAAGTADDFADVPLDVGWATGFQRRVLAACRRIGYGSTATYAELAAKAGSPRAARAVGNCMAANRIPLVMPCHRVVRSNGELGSYSAPGGVKTKRKLLWLEGNK